MLSHVSYITQSSTGETEGCLASDNPQSQLFFHYNIKRQTTLVRLAYYCISTLFSTSFNLGLSFSDLITSFVL